MSIGDFSVISTRIGKPQAIISVALVLPLFKIIRHLDFFRCIAFIRYLDKCISNFIAKAMYLEQPKHLRIWNGGSTSFQSYYVRQT